MVVGALEAVCSCTRAGFTHQEPTQRRSLKPARHVKSQEPKPRVLDIRSNLHCREIFKVGNFISRETAAGACLEIRSIVALQSDVASSEHTPISPLVLRTAPMARLLWAKPLGSGGITSCGGIGNFVGGQKSEGISGRGCCISIDGLRVLQGVAYTRSAI
jgi:hypothetical protein